MDLIEAGKIINTHGIKGEIKLQIWADDPYILAEFDEFYIDGLSYTVEFARIHKDFLIIKFKGIDSISEAEKFKNKVIFADSNLFDLDEGVFFVKDLFGIEVYDVDTGVFYGKITDVMQTGANDVYEVTEEKEDTKIKRLIPAIKSCIINVDMEKRQMQIRPLEGLFDI